MTIQGIIVLILIGLALLVWILNLIRRDRLYAGYGIVFIFAIIGVILILAIPKLLITVTHLVGAIFPASALTLLALCFIVFLLVYILTQVTIVSNRLATVVQQLAIQQARESARHTTAQTAPTSEQPQPDEP